MHIRQCSTKKQSLKKVSSLSADSALSITFGGGGQIGVVMEYAGVTDSSDGEKGSGSSTVKLSFFYTHNVNIHRRGGKDWQSAAGVVLAGRKVLKTGFKVTASS